MQAEPEPEAVTPAPEPVPDPVPEPVVEAVRALPECSLCFDPYDGEQPGC